MLQAGLSQDSEGCCLLSPQLTLNALVTNQVPHWSTKRTRIFLPIMCHSGANPALSAPRAAPLGSGPGRQQHRLLPGEMQPPAPPGTAHPACPSSPRAARPDPQPRRVQTLWVPRTGREHHPGQALTPLGMLCIQGREGERGREPVKRSAEIKTLYFSKA